MGDIIGPVCVLPPQHGDWRGNPTDPLWTCAPAVGGWRADACAHHAQEGVGEMRAPPGHARCEQASSLIHPRDLEVRLHWLSTQFWQRR